MRNRYLKCTSTSAHSLGNKQKELELHAQPENYIIGITETWWNNSHDWKITTDGYRLFCKGRKEEKESHSTLRRTLNVYKSVTVTVEVLPKISGSGSEGSSPKGDLTVGISY